MRIDEKRFRATFEALTADGRTPEGGLNRPALSRAHLAARHSFAELIAVNGFALRTDGAGNLSAWLHCADPEAPSLVLGSHLDSVPHGGRFDGALGVAAAFEVLLSLRDSGKRLSTNIEVIDFTDEEGTWVSLLGSRAVSGQILARDLDKPRGNPEGFEEALARAGLTKAGILGASRVDEAFRAYLELHIEQGERLESSGTDIGVVSGMVGIFMYLVTFRGTASHAGTTPVKRRRDAAQGASAFALQVRQIVLKHFPDCVANVGNMTFAPGLYNVVAHSATCFLELRSSEGARARQLETALDKAAVYSAKRFGLTVDFKFLEAVEPRKMDFGIQHTFRTAAESLGLTTRTLPSMAGHDAQNMALLCPAGLAFVPSAGGYSHSAREYTSWNSCVNGCQVLLETACRLLVSS